MMAGAAHDPVFAKKVGVSPKVAKEFNKADDKSGFLGSAMRAKGPAFQEGGKVERKYLDYLGPVGGIYEMITDPGAPLRRKMEAEKSKKSEYTGKVPGRRAPGDLPAGFPKNDDDELRGMPDLGRKSPAPDRQTQFLEQLDKDVAAGAARRAQEAKDRAAARAKAPPPRSDKDNPDAATITRGPRYAKGGSVKGGGCEKRGTRPAKYY